MAETTKNWLSKTNCPRFFAGEISAINIGVTTVIHPKSTPVINRKNNSNSQLKEVALPRVASANKPDNIIKDLRRPYFSAGLPIIKVPTIVPRIAMATVKPSHVLFKLKMDSSCEVVPDIMAISYPNRNPPSAIMIATVNTFCCFIFESNYWFKILNQRYGSTHGDAIRLSLLYTSDAADEEDSVDLGGRRIIKKKKKK